MNLTQRESASIGIYRPNANSTSSLITTVTITAASRRTFKLMEEDSITLVWCDTNLFRFLPGDYIVDELFGRFVVAAEQTGQWNKTSGGYDYQLKLVSEYWMWNNYLLMYTQEIVSSGGGGGGFIGDEIVPRRHAPGTATGNTKRYEARYHLTGQLQDHVGVVLENVKILNLVANATYTKSISAERRDEVHYICYDGMHICDALTAIANEYETEWWVTRNGNTITIHMEKCESQGNAVVLNTGAPGYEIETLSVSRNQNTYANRIYALGSDKNIPRSYGKAQSDKNYITCKITTFETVSQQGTTPPDPETDPRYTDGHLKPIDDNGEEIDISIPTVEYYRFKDTNHVIAQNMCHMGRVEVTINSASQALFIDGEGYLFYTTCPDAWNVQTGTEFRVNIYDPSNANKPYGLYENKIPESWFADSSDDPSSVYSFGERRLMLPSTYPDEWEDGYIIGGYRRWVQKSILPQQNVVEQVVIFDNIYPKCYLKVTSVKEEAASQKEVFDDGSFIMWNWTRYTIEAVQYPSGDPFKFDAGFTDGKLEATFLSDMDEQDAFYERVTSGTWQPGSNQRLLAGMTFGVGFRIETIDNVKHYYYELVRNEDYGTLLPNDVLKPTIGDVFVLTGWDVKAMKMTGLIESAEDALAMAALEYLQAMEEGQFTFQLGMMTQWALGGSQSDYTLPDPGQKYSLPLPIGNGRKVSRLIGYELKLDMPYDSPQLTVGETEAYSRLKRMERRMSGSVTAGYTSKPSSHMPRVIYFRVYTFLSHVSAVGDVPSRVRIVMPLEIELATDEGYAISNVIVRMDGEVVDGAWDAETNTVLVDAVVGDIEIVADAEWAMPYDAEVEWIQCDGNARINTGIKVTPTTTFHFEMYMPQAELTKQPFGGRSAYQSNALHFANDTRTSGGTNVATWYYGNKSATTTKLLGWHTFDNTAAVNKLVIDNNTTLTITGASMSSTNEDFYLFRMNVGGGSGGNNGDGIKSKGGQMYSGGVLVRDYIPVRKNGVGYLYDRVSGELFGNANESGAFSYGEDV